MIIDHNLHGFGSTRYNKQYLFFFLVFFKATQAPYVNGISKNANDETESADEEQINIRARRFYGCLFFAINFVESLILGSSNNIFFSNIPK